MTKEQNDLELNRFKESLIKLRESLIDYNNAYGKSQNCLDQKAERLGQRASNILLNVPYPYSIDCESLLDEAFIEAKKRSRINPREVLDRAHARSAKAVKESQILRGD